MKQPFGLVCLLGAIFVPVGLAQSEPNVASVPVVPSVAVGPDIPNLRVGVQQISESRSTSGSGSINVILAISGEGLPPIIAVKQVNVTKAADNRDRPLITPAGGASMSLLTQSSFLSRAGRGGSAPITAIISLGNSVRDAGSVKFIEGTLDLFMPSETNGGILRIRNIKSHPGRLEHLILAKYGIVFVFMGDKANTDEALAERGPGITSVNATTDGVTGYGYYYRDPSGTVTGVALQNGRGESVRSSGNGGYLGPTSAFSTYGLAGPLTDDDQLVIYLAVPEAIKRVPFRVDDIPLP